MSEEDMIATRALWLREEEAVELVRAGELDGWEALRLVVAPPPAVLEASIERAGARPFAPRDFQPGDRCRNGHERTPDNTYWADKERGSLRCMTCNNEGMRRRYASQAERRREVRRASHHRRMQDPEVRERKNAQNRAWWARNKHKRNQVRRAAETGTPESKPTRSRSQGKAA